MWIRYLYSPINFKIFYVLDFCHWIADSNVSLTGTKFWVIFLLSCYWYFPYHFIKDKPTWILHHWWCSSWVESNALQQREFDLCCGKELSFDKITFGFWFVPGRNRVCEMFNDDSGYHLVPGTAVCLTRSLKKRKKRKRIKVMPPMKRC